MRLQAWALAALLAIYAAHAASVHVQPQGGARPQRGLDPLSDPYALQQDNLNIFRLSQATRRQLLAQNSTGGNASTCACQADLPKETVLQISEVSGWLPFLRTYTAEYQQQLQGNPSVIKDEYQRFNSPADMVTLHQMYPEYNIFWFEVTKSPRMVPYLSPQPDWVAALAAGSPPTTHGPATPATPAASSSPGSSRVASPSAAPEGGNSTGAPAPTNTTRPAAAAVPSVLVSVAYYNLYAQADALLQVQPVMLVYRHDILEARGYAVPETWEQLLEMAELLNGTDFNDDGKGDHALCVDVDPNCKSYWLFSAVAASILQANGTASGYLIDPASGSQLISSGGMVRALTLWRYLMAYNSPAMANAKCGLWEDMFARGKCAFTLSYKQIHGNVEGTYAYGRTSTAPTPGSLEVWDRANQTMAPCDARRCPFAVPLQTPRLMRPTRNYTRGQAYIASPLVNRAPVICNIGQKGVLMRGAQATAGGLDLYQKKRYFDMFNWPLLTLLGSFFIQTPEQRRSFSFNNLDVSDVNMTYYAGADFIVGIYGWANSLRNQTSWDPYAVQPSQDPRLFLRLAEYYHQDPDEASAYMRTWAWSLLHPNMAMDPQKISLLRAAVANAASQAVQGVDMQYIKAGLDYKMGPSMWGSVPAAWWTLTSYQAELGYVNATDTHTGWDTSARSTGGDDGWNTGELAAVIVVPLCVGFLAVIGFLVYLKRSKSAIDMFGKVRSPGLGPGTTMVVTDIQNSTHLWESLSHQVMDVVIRVHHETLRGLLRKHKGYETTTEGDSFLLAFHTPGDALDYCLSVQAALTSAAWPEQLLNNPNVAADAAPVHLAYKASNFSWFDRNCAVLEPSWRQWLDAPMLRAHKRAGIFLRQISGSLLGSSRNTPGMPRMSTRTDSYEINPSLRLALGSHYDSNPRSNNYGRPSMSSDTYADVTIETLETRTADVTSQSLGVNKPSNTDDSDRMVKMQQDANANAKDGDSGSLDVIGDPGQRGMTLKQWLAAEVQQVDDPAMWQQLQQLQPVPNQQQVVTVFRGLRVRMGVHSGIVNPQDWKLNKSTGRMCASGAFLATAKAIGDVGAGGMIVLSSSAMSALTHYGLPASLVILHMGEHQLKDLEGSQPLYCALPTALISRMAIFPDLRSLQICSPGIYSAPRKAATVVFMHSVGYRSLQSWDEQLAKDALHLYHEVITRQLLDWDGYLVELADGFCLAAFCDPGDAVGWALSCQSDLLTQDWDPKLLRHELCEEVTVVVQAAMAPQHPASVHGTRGSWRHSPAPKPDAAHLITSESVMSLVESARPPSVAAQNVTMCVAEATMAATTEASQVADMAGGGSDSSGEPEVTPRERTAGPRRRSARAGLSERRTSCVQVQRRTILRGLRIKVGMAMGAVNAHVSPITGRMELRGKVMNRAARITALASSSQVLCSSAVWSGALAASRLQQLPVMGSSLGHQSLKGINGKVEIIHVTLGDNLVPVPGATMCGATAAAHELLV